MANILDYLDWRGDLTLAERGFNEVDNLLMAELCFLDFSGIVPADFSAPVFLPDAMRQYDAARPQETMGVLVPEQIPELGRKMAASRRFSDLTLCAYVSRTDEETQTQFSALTALLPDKTAYIAFRGTDDTIVGWKEDFNLAFLPVVPAQRMAAESESRLSIASPVWCSSCREIPSWGRYTRSSRAKPIPRPMSSSTAAASTGITNMAILDRARRFLMVMAMTSHIESLPLYHKTSP